MRPLRRRAHWSPLLNSMFHRGQAQRCKSDCGCGLALGGRLFQSFTDWGSCICNAHHRLWRSRLHGMLHNLAEDAPILRSFGRRGGGHQARINCTMRSCRNRGAELFFQFVTGSLGRLRDTLVLLWS